MSIVFYIICIKQNISITKSVQCFFDIVCFIPSLIGNTEKVSETQNLGFLKIFFRKINFRSELRKLLFLEEKDQKDKFLTAEEKTYFKNPFYFFSVSLS